MGRPGTLVFTKEATADAVAQPLVEHLESEMPNLWTQDDESEYGVRFASIVGTRVAKETRSGLTPEDRKSLGRQA